jgi:tetratricopeptide (TPR) repeat protein
MSRNRRGLLVKRAESAMRKKRWLDAIAVFKEKPSVIEKDWKALWNLGWCYYNLEKFNEAGKYFNLADASVPGNPICKWARDLVYIRKRRYKKAEQVLLESLRLKERFHTRIALALAYLAQGKVALAEKTHLDGIEIGTRLSERYESYAAFLSDAGREDEAKQMNDQVRRIRSVH